MSSEIFFHPDFERGVDRRRRTATAKLLCQQCPVLQQCRTHALAAREPYGVWGGLSAEERHQLLHTSSTVHITTDFRAPR